MATEIKVPTLGESVTEATIGQWFKATGDAVQADEPLVELETDKVTIEVPAPVSGTMGDIVAPEGETVEVGALLAMLLEGEGAAAAPAPKKEEAKKEPAAAAAPAASSAAPTSMPPAPSAAKMMTEQKVDPASVSGTGVRGQVLKGDVINAIAGGVTAPAGSAPQPAAKRPASAPDDAAREERVRMTKLRQTIARRLKDAQNTAAMLTTFNDVDMSAVMGMRKQYKDLFEKKHGVRLGFMGFFAKAICKALEEIPAVNAEIDGTDLVYKHFVHLGVAVGSPRGLVVPVLRDADQKSLSEIEKEISDFGRRARDGQLTIEEMQGGTFTVSNGGVYGSMMSTPILNAPQSGILGMHRIEERPVVRNGEIVIRPMMYLALSYDHRVVDGKEAVTFLVRIKESLEDPQRLVMDI
ncbi:2-oxoglutarate dehydrogenase complex dihydrolipoyllysine-residue succinyltransferase [uncultured Cohaesibacter sp.]|uniref:2-oxoglutarate dehydrogenase complex dihydrolipoyllysine-residue succinyltransferase n=1 Tax=uncultured Cohaesibacter sp. TaxID=1002546 RepID=UPI002AA60AD9|nr:2-oxoglutarate dehydrogenase complex dihydrolipoyllysine-residue succinyltransferase [uncultured Cohaesibacter sp.]